MTKKELVDWLTELEINNEMWKFYKCREWIQLRDKVLQEHHYECQICRSKGKITKAQTVHHVNYVKDRKDLALTRYVIDKDGNRIINLIPLCNTCHNNVHYNDKLGKKNNANKEDINEERWD